MWYSKLKLSCAPKEEDREAAFNMHWSKSVFPQIPQVYFMIKQVYYVLIIDKKHMDSIW